MEFTLKYDVYDRVRLRICMAAEGNHNTAHANRKPLRFATVQAITPHNFVKSP